MINIEDIIKLYNIQIIAIAFYFVFIVFIIGFVFYKFYLDYKEEIESTYKRD